MAMIAKLSLATALSNVRQLVGELGKAAREAAGLPGLEVVTKGVEGLEEYSNPNRKALDVELVVVAPAGAADAQRGATWIGGNFNSSYLQSQPPQVTLVNLREVDGGAPLRVEVKGLSTTHARAAGTPRPPVLLLLVGSPGALHAENVASIEGLMEDRPFVALVGPASQPSMRELETRAQNLAWTSTLVDLSAPPEATLQAQLGAPPWGPAHELLKAHSTLVALDSLVGVFDLALQQQARDIKVKRSAAQAKLGPAKPGPGAAVAKPASPASDVLADIKARVQRHSQEFERGATERLQDLLGGTSGSLVRETEAMLLSLDKLDEHEKSTKIETRLPAEFEKKLVRTVRERIARHCGADVVALNDMFRLLAHEIERSLAAAQGPPYVPHFTYLTEDRVRRVLDLYAGLQVTYRGELPRRGFSEYFASVRKYSMLLVMCASMFGLSSMMRQYREFTVPLTILLVLFGSYSVAASTRQQRVESLDKELEASRNALRPELKKVFTEVQKNWSTTVTQFMNEQIAGVLAELDAAVKEHQARRGAESTPEKERLQRQVQALDASEKKLTAPNKAKDALLASVAQIKGELKQLLPRPGAPSAAPAAAGMLGDARARLDALKAQAAQKAAAPAPSGAPSPLEAAKAKLAALKSQAAEATPAVQAPAAQAAAPPPAAAEPAAAPSALEAAKARFAALRAQGGEKKATGSEAAAAPAKPSAAEEAKAKFAALRAQAAEKKAAASEAAAAPAKPSATDEAKARFAALKAQAAERKAAKPAARDAKGPETATAPAAAGAAAAAASAPDAPKAQAAAPPVPAAERKPDAPAAGAAPAEPSATEDAKAGAKVQDPEREEAKPAGPEVAVPAEGSAPDASAPPAPAQPAPGPTSVDARE